MNILLVTMGMDIGGAETHILELAKELKKRNNTVYVASNGGKYTEELKENNIEHIWAPLHDKNIFNMIKSYRILTKTIKDKKIDLVHSHSRISSFICGILHKKMHFPFVTTAHWTFKVTPLLKKMTNWGEYVVAVSDDIKEYLMENYGIDSSKIIVTVNGIDTEKFSKNTNYDDILQEFSLSKDARRIVYVSRMDESRALVARQLIDISESLNKKIENLEIVIVGGGDVYDELSQKCDEINNKLHKKLLIMTNARTDINKFIASSEIFIGVSRAALEAMAAEKPVIVAGNEGYLGIFDENKLEDAIKTNFCCRGLEMSNTDLLRNDILKLISAENKEDFGKYNKSIVQEYYSIEKMADDCETAYKKVSKNC